MNINTRDSFDEADDFLQRHNTVFNPEEPNYLQTLDPFFKVNKEPGQITIQSKLLNEQPKFLDFLLASMVVTAFMIVMFFIMFDIRLVESDSTGIITISVLVMMFGSTFLLFYLYIIPFRNYYNMLYFTNEKVSLFKININGKKTPVRKLSPKNIKRLTKKGKDNRQFVNFIGKHHKLFIDSDSNDEKIYSTFVHLIYDLKKEKSISLLN